MLKLLSAPLAISGPLDCESNLLLVLLGWYSLLLWGFLRGGVGVELVGGRGALFLSSSIPIYDRRIYIYM